MAPSKSKISVTKIKKSVVTRNATRKDGRAGKVVESVTIQLKPEECRVDSVMIDGWNEVRFSQPIQIDHIRIDYVLGKDGGAGRVQARAIHVSEASAAAVHKTKTGPGQLPIASHSDQPSTSYLLPESFSTTEVKKDSAFYTIEAILEKRQDRNSRKWYYMVAWEGYDERTWEPVENFTSISIAQQFEAELAAKAAASSVAASAKAKKGRRPLKREPIIINDPEPPVLQSGAGEGRAGQPQPANTAETRTERALLRGLAKSSSPPEATGYGADGDAKSEGGSGVVTGQLKIGRASSI